MAASVLPVCAHEALDCFTAKATLEAGSVVVELLAVSEDLPTPGYINRWHYVMGPEARPALNHLREDGPFAAEVCGAAIWLTKDRLEGGMTQAAAGYWFLHLSPLDAGVRSQFAELVPAAECRQQVFEVNLLSSGLYEILITELSQ